MNDQELRGIIQRLVLVEMARLGHTYAPVMSSNRHCHLSREDTDRLFGPGYQLTKLRDLVQPGQYACNEKVTMETPKGAVSLRVVGPIRKETQVELSLTDSAKLGLKPPVRMSGRLEDTPGCILKQGDRNITIPRGVIVAARHIHMSAEEAAAYGVKNGDTVSLEVEGPRATTLGNVIVRSGEGHVLEVHIDKDEANACGLEDGTLCRVIVPGRAPKAETPAATRQPSEPAKPTMLDLTGEKARLITEEDVLRAHINGYRVIRYGKDAILTPLARDAAREKRVELAKAPE
jgi:putative phosphotransacetylase